MKLECLGKISSLAIVGASDLIGREMLEILAEHNVRIPDIKRFAPDFLMDDSSDPVLPLGKADLGSFEAALFSIPNDLSRKYVPIALRAGCLVVDDSRVFRMQEDVPLVVPQVNGGVLRDFDGHLVATPSGATTPIAMCLKPLADRFGLERVVVSTYQSVSGAGKPAYEELSEQTARLLNGQGVEPVVFPHQVAFNCLPAIGAVDPEGPNGNTEEEEGIIRELGKVLALGELRVSATAVRVPTFCGNGASVNVELQEDFGSIDEIREMFDSFPGIKALDRPESHIYPTNVEATGSDYTFVGRIRRDRSVPSGINFWVMTDNLRKGAALNALETLDMLYHYRNLI